jgi:hypothetical protein
LEAFHVGPPPDYRRNLPDQALYVFEGGMSRATGSFFQLKNLWTDLVGRERRMTVSLPEKTYSVVDLLLWYSQSHVWQPGIRQVSGYIATEIATRPIPYSQPGPLSRDAFDEHIRNVLASNGVTLVQINREFYKAVPTATATNYHVAFRERTSSMSPATLPAKAPVDATWLNPFGPLTTKAAKAAKPVVRYEGPVERLQYNSPIKHLLLSRILMPIGDGFSKNQISLGGMSNLSALQISMFYANSYQPIRLETSPALKDLKIDISSYQPARNREFRRQLAELLQKNGVTLQNEGGILRAFPTKDAILTPINPKPYALLYTYSLIIALVCGTAGLPHILVRFYTNPDGAAAKRTTMWVMILIGIFYVFPPVFGVLGRNLMPGLYDGVGVNGTDGIVLKLPTLLGDKYGVLGSILSGITCAGAFAAFMSTFSGLLVSMTGALAHDVYGRILRPKSTPAERMRMFKFCAIGVGTVAVLLGTLVENFEINFMVGQAFAIAAASYFPLLFMSVWWRGMTTRGAATGMLTGGLLAVAAISLTSWTTFITTQAAKFKSMGVTEPGWFVSLKPYSLTEYWSEHPLLRILCEQPALWAVPTAIALMVIVSKLTRSSIPKDIRMKMLVLHAPEALGLKQEYIREHEAGH